MLERRSLEEPVRHRQRLPVDQPTSLAGRPCFVANRSPVMRVNDHQRAKVLPVLVVMEHARLVLFPLIRQLERSTDRLRLHVPLWGSSLRGR
jgi:hypothetical protein